MLGSKLPKLTRVFLVIILGTVLSLLGEIIPDDIKTDFGSIAVSFGLTYRQCWYLCVGIVSLILILFTYWGEKEKRVGSKEIAELQREHIVQTLLESYEDRLKQKLDQRIPLGLELKYTKEGTSEIYAETYFAKDARDEMEIHSTLSTILQKHSSLLIIGEPGAGKTTLLLDLAIVLLKYAKHNKSSPYPVILDLSSWQLENDFAEWCQDILVNGYGFNPKLAKYVIEKRNLLPFLDGLDEISDKVLRSDCLEKLQFYLYNYEPQNLVICSRIDEYKEIVGNAPVRAEVLVKDLTEQQIRGSLQEIIDNQQKPEDRPFANPITARNLLTLMDKSSSFARAISTPFYFNLASQLFNDPESIKEIPGGEKMWQIYLIDKFVENKLGVFFKEFPVSKRNKYWLSWLADVIRRKKITSFELSSFQPDFLNGRKKFILIVALFFIMIIWPLFMLTISIFPSLLAALVLGFGVTLDIQVKTEDMRKWKWDLLFSPSKWAEILIVSLVGGLFGGVLFGLLWGNFLASGLASFSAIAVYFSAEEFFQITHFSKTMKAYQRLRSGLLFNALKVALITFIAMSVYLYFISRLEMDFAILFVVFIVGAIIGVFYSPFFNHFILRLCFYLEGSIPIRFVDFLKYATDMRILENNGGQWRFRHRILQDHFADLYH
ncbi:MAG TPA: hypothetical protein VGO50_07590 [Pyrinomonadaceae bacterium]|jgi:hypothetical protein|nr:hypothetical protein [Pyrinomonadaceae bacterium]